jgi:four helix bundle protein
MHNFKELKVWQDSMELSKIIYGVTKHFPIEERFNLTSQIARCSISIPSNIAEGCGRATDKDFLRFLAISRASTYELETQLILAHDFNYLSANDFSNIIDKLAQIQRMLNGLIQNLHNKLKNQTEFKNPTFLQSKS